MSNNNNNFKLDKKLILGELKVRSSLALPKYDDIDNFTTNSRSKRGMVAFDNLTSSLCFNNGKEWVRLNESTGNFVEKSGDTMTGNLDMGGNSVLNIAPPGSSGDAVNKAYVDNTFVDVTGDTMTGNLTMNGGNLVMGVNDEIQFQYDNGGVTQTSSITHASAGSETELKFNVDQLDMTYIQLWDDTAQGELNITTIPSAPAGQDFKIGPQHAGNFVLLRGFNGTTGGLNGGNKIMIDPSGNVFIYDLPTADPGILDALYIGPGGVLTVSGY